MFGDLSQQTFDLLNKADLSSLNKTTISQATISGVAGIRCGLSSHPPLNGRVGDQLARCGAALNLAKPCWQGLKPT